jgi:hypothetical protein
LRAGPHREVAVSRLIFRISTLLASVLLTVTLAAPARAATGIDILDAQLLDRGTAVQVTAAVSCDLLGPDSVAYLSVTLWQGVYPHPRYIEGFGSYDGLVCDETPHTYSLTVRPTSFYADKRFTAGRAMTESGVTVCTLVAPGSYFCTPVGALVRQTILIHP